MTAAAAIAEPAAPSRRADDPRGWAIAGERALDAGDWRAAGPAFARAELLAPGAGADGLARAAMLADRTRIADTRLAWAKAATGDRTRDFQRLLLAPRILSSAEGMFEARERLVGALEAMAEDPPDLSQSLHRIHNAHFHRAYQGLDELPVQRAIARIWRRGCPRLSFVAPHARDPEPPAGRLKLGILSSHFQRHTITRLNLRLIERLPRDRLHVTVVLSGPVRDRETERVRRAADAVLDLAQAARGKPIETAFEAIAAQRFDVLHFPDIGMDVRSYYLGFGRLAPVQTVTWGHPLTTGIDTLDHFVSARGIETEQADAHYTERLVRLDALGVCLEAPPAPAALDRAALGFPEAGRVYLCPQTPIKMHPDFDALIADILRRDPEGWVLLMRDAGRGGHLQVAARLARSIPDVAGRVGFLPIVRPEVFMARLAAADVVLDTPHFSGGLSTLEALGVGAPVVAWPGPFTRSRLTLAWYRALGIDDLVANAAEEYVETALSVARDNDRRADLRSRILARRDVLFDDDATVEAYASLFEQVCRREAPRPQSDAHRHGLG